MIIQLNPSISVETRLGKGKAIFLIDDGTHQNNCFLIAFENHDIIKYFDCNDVVILTNSTHQLNTSRNINLH